MDFSPANFLDFNETDHARLFEGVVNVWEALPAIKPYLADCIAKIDPALRLAGDVSERAVVGPDVYVAEGAVVEPNAVIKGPAWIGSGTVVRSGAYVRENVIVGNDCTLGNSSEFKNCLLFNRCEVPHFNYVGDSILGFKAHLGAGVICSNVRLDRTEVKLKVAGLGRLETGLRKFGAVIGDYTEVGCNTVLSPGSILGRNSIIYPLTSWSGILGDYQIVKNLSPTKVVARN